MNGDNQDQIILMDWPVPIITPRLTLHPVMPGEGAETYAAIIETQDQLRLWMPWMSAPQTVDTAEANIRRAHAQYILREDFRLAGRRRDTGELVICCGLHRFNWPLRHVEIGYWVRAGAQGNGFATEAANALTRYAFTVMQARRVMIAHAEGNDASRAVIQKLGFPLEAVRRQAHGPLPDGRIVDDYTYVRFDTDGLPDLDVRWGPEP